MRDRNEATPEAAGSSMKWKRIIPRVFFWMSLVVIWATNYMIFFVDEFSQLDVIQAMLLAVFGIGMANYFKIGLNSDE